MDTTSISVIDLFAGVGGLSLGARNAGLDMRLLVECDPVACQTLRQNADSHGGVVLEADLTTLTGGEIRELAGLSRGDLLLIVGGPPCQPFSKASYWTDPGEEARYRRARARGQVVPRPDTPIAPRPDSRRSLVQEFLRIVEEAEADAFIFENVPSILHPRNRPTLDTFMLAAEAAGFHTTLIRAKAVEFGVPQRRERVVVMAARRAKPCAPMPTHAVDSSSGLPLRSAVTAGEALTAYADPRFFEPEEVVKGRWAEHLRGVPPGWNYKAHTAWGGHPNPTFETETRFWNFLLKLSPDKPSWTIPANPGPWTGPFHWENRRLRTPELAALQGFPDGYRIAGTRRERVRQIGNAVPPPLARRMLEQVASALVGSKAGPQERRR